MKYVLLLTLTALSLFAADVTGTWTGTFTPDGEDAGPAHLVLKQDGATLTGTAGPGAEEQHEISNGKAADGKITFEVATDDATMKFVLTQDGDNLSGDVSREHDGEVQKAKLSVTRKK